MDAAFVSGLIRPFAQLGLNDRASVGGKGASLGELTRAGIPVPPGFVVDTMSFHLFVESIDPGGRERRALEALEPNNTAAIAKAGSAMRALVEQADMPGALVAAIVRSYQELGAGPVAVRSSATGEDSEEASFAGLQDTYLWVMGEDNVVEKVRSCWASLYSAESLSYRRKLRLGEDGLAMGVVVQRMVEAACSGVMFTRSPATGDRSVVVVEGSYGLGSCVVSGEVTPDRFVINKITGEISERSISHKAQQHLPDLEHGGVHSLAVPDAAQMVACLADEKLHELAALARRVERHYGSPQDIEWAMERDGTLFLLQSRPETVWSRREAQPIAKATSNPLDHLFAAFGGQR
jgi:pyruvate,water dikinase